MNKCKKKWKVFSFLKDYTTSKLQLKSLKEELLLVKSELHEYTREHEFVFDANNPLLFITVSFSRKTGIMNPFYRKEIVRQFKQAKMDKKYNIIFIPSESQVNLIK
jgi:hypothetical protein